MKKRTRTLRRKGLLVAAAAFTAFTVNAEEPPPVSYDDCLAEAGVAAQSETGLALLACWQGQERGAIPCIARVTARATRDGLLASEEKAKIQTCSSRVNERLLRGK